MHKIMTLHITNNFEIPEETKRIAQQLIAGY
jgi:hypothetical protein